MARFSPRWLRNPRIVAPAAVVLIGFAAWLAFGYFAVHLLWVDDKVDEAVPTFDAPPVSTAPTTVATPGPSTTAAAAGTIGAPPTSTALIPDRTVAATEPVPDTTAPAAVEVVTEATGSFVSLDHDTHGRAVVLGNGSGQRFLRFEEFSTSNGPDLNVYLVNSSVEGVTDYVDLGDMKGNVGDQNYEIPAGVDLAVHDTVLIWCVRFSSAFGEALLEPA